MDLIMEEKFKQQIYIYKLSALFNNALHQFI